MNKDKRNNIQVLGTLNNADESGIIANANQIYDDVQQKAQETINSELIAAVGTGGSVDTRITNAVNVEKTRAQIAESNLQELYGGLTQSNIEVVNTLPKTGEAYKIYRLIGINSYADYMYNSSDLTTPIKMAEYDNAIDTEPTAGSDNLVKSGGVYDAIAAKSEMLHVDKDGFHVIDEDLNVGTKYDKDGLDAARVSSHFVEILKSAGISTGDVMTSHAAEVNESGFFIVDESLNVGVKLDSGGIHAKNILEYEIIED